MMRREYEVQESVIGEEEAGGCHKTVGERPVKTTIDQYLLQNSEHAKYSRTLNQQKHFDLELITMIATCKFPYNSVDQEGFRRFVAYLAPKFTDRAGT